MPATFIILNLPSTNVNFKLNIPIKGPGNACLYFKILFYSYLKRHNWLSWQVHHFMKTFLMWTLKYSCLVFADANHAAPKKKLRNDVIFTCSATCHKVALCSFFLYLIADFSYSVCCIFWPVFGCCTPQTLVEIFIFSIFCAKKLKMQKRKKFAAKFSKITWFLSLHQNAGQMFYSRIKQVFSYKNTFLPIKGNPFFD